MNCLVIGGTGTMGRLVIKRLLNNGHKVTCFSRDEQKQRTMPNDINLNCVIGDIRDYDSVVDVMGYHFDIVLNLAALKCVDTMEANPYESIKTNIMGTQNIIRAAQHSSLPKIFFTSSDKACYPINVYGQSKAIAEKLVLDYKGPSTVFRYGNILGSRGSVLSTFIVSLIKEQIAYITDVNMTRFWVLADEIADFICHQIELNTNNNTLSIKLTKTMRVVDVARCVGDLLDVPKISYRDIGVRPGEKLHETMVTKYDDIREYPNDVDSFSHERYENEEFKDLIAPLVKKIRGQLNI